LCEEIFDSRDISTTTECDSEISRLADMSSLSCLLISPKLKFNPIQLRTVYIADIKRHTVTHLVHNNPHTVEDWLNFQPVSCTHTEQSYIGTNLT